jgi:acetate kinase
MRERAMSAAEIEDCSITAVVFLGVSGIFSDICMLLGNNALHAREALDLFVFRAARKITQVAPDLTRKTAGKGHSSIA